MFPSLLLWFLPPCGRNLRILVQIWKQQYHKGSVRRNDTKLGAVLEAHKRASVTPTLKTLLEMARSHAKGPTHKGFSWFWLLLFLFICSVNASRRPNFVIILTDDQDLHTGSMDYMSTVQKYIRDQGAVYQNHYCPTSICCPARATVWTRKAAHNTNVTDVISPYGVVFLPVRVR